MSYLLKKLRSDVKELITEYTESLIALQHNLPAFNTIKGRVEAHNTAVIKNCRIEGTLIAHEGAVVLDCRIPQGATLTVGANSRVINTVAGPIYYYTGADNKYTDAMEICIGENSIVNTLKTQSSIVIGDNCIIQRLIVERKFKSKIANHCILFNMSVCKDTYSNTPRSTLEIGEDNCITDVDLDIGSVTIAKGVTITIIESLYGERNLEKDLLSTSINHTLTFSCRRAGAFKRDIKVDIGENATLIVNRTSFLCNEFTMGSNSLIYASDTKSLRASHIYADKIKLANGSKLYLEANQSEYLLYIRDLVVGDKATLSVKPAGPREYRPRTAPEKTSIKIAANTSVEFQV